MKDNTIYYTIINKSKLKSITKIKNERLETTMCFYALSLLLKLLNIKEKCIYKTKLGKPYFKNSNIHFNYSHSKNYIAVAISKSNIGIDIEETNRRINDVMIKQCHFTEDDSLKELVKRESYCKYTGEGIKLFFNKNNFTNINKYIKLIANKKYICAIFSKVDKPSYRKICITKKIY